MFVWSGGEDPCAAAQSGSGRGQGGVSGGVPGPGVPHHHHINGNQGFHFITVLYHSIFISRNFDFYFATIQSMISYFLLHYIS